VTPERVVIAEARRMLAYLALYDYAVDAVFVNRVPPPDLPAELAPWFAAPQEQLDLIDSAFGALPRLAVRRRVAEPLGPGPLGELGRELYGACDPLARLAPAQALEIATSGEESVVRVPVPGVERDRIGLERSSDELIVTLGAHRRSVLLPEALRRRDVVRAGLNGQHLEVVFAEPVDVRR